MPRKGNFSAEFVSQIILKSQLWCISVVHAAGLTGQLMMNQICLLNFVVPKLLSFEH